MPELPEAEANRRRIEDGALNRTIERVELGNDTTHVELPGKGERDGFVGRQFTQTHRHGKMIFAGSKSGPWMAVHLGMTGSLRIYDAEDAAPDYTRITFVFEGDRRLSYRCPRKLGWVRTTDDPADFIERQGLGPDAMDIDADTFASRVGASKGALKSALLSQKKLAGVGNLWSDETCFQAGLMPDVVAAELSRGAVDGVHDTMRRVLGAVLDANADYSKLPDNWLIHHRKEGADCPRCGGTIVKKTVGGRSAYHCPDHQQEGG